MQDPAERRIFLLVAGSGAAVLVSIAVAQILLVAACLYWLYTRSGPVRWPSYFLPVCALVLTTLVSVALSPDPAAGIWSVRKFWLFSMGLIAANFVTTPWRALTAHRLLLLVAASASLVGMVQFAFKYAHFLQTGDLADDPMVLARITGLNGHWMTFSGGLLLAWCAALPALIVLGQRWIIPACVVGLGIILSFTRSVWVGAATGFAVVSFTLPKRLLIGILLPLILAGAGASGLIYRRIAMSFEAGFAPDLARLSYLDVGTRMIKDHPFFGVGPEQVDDEFPRYYRGSDLDTFYYGHLHNNMLQLGAERGLLCLAAFLWFVVELYRSLFRLIKVSDESHRWISLSALSALTGFLVAGLFEYNFGDSEVLLLLLFIVSVPFGAAAGGRLDIEGKSGVVLGKGRGGGQ